MQLLLSPFSALFIAVGLVVWSEMCVRMDVIRMRGMVTRWTPRIAASVWLVYAIYAWRMQIWSATQAVPIRMDLMFIAPVLIFVTIMGIVACLSK